jgi:hypothetical protein
LCVSALQNRLVRNDVSNAFVTLSFDPELIDRPDELTVARAILEAEKP